jgi:PAS domain S-box-containing protein
VPEIVLVLASVTALYSLAAYLIVKDNRLHLAGLIAYVAMCITVILLVVLSGGIHSPFIGLWLLVAGFSGLFGIYMIGAFAIAANVYGLYYLATGLETGAAAIALMIVVEAPLIASFIIWHNRINGHDTQAVNALQAQLSQVSSKSDVIINSIADGVVVIDSRGIVQLINPAAQTMLGWPNRDAVGLDYRSVIKLVDTAGNPVAEELSPIRQVMASNKSATNNDLILVTKSSKKVLVSLVVSPVGEDSHQTGVIAVFRDITREKEEERQKAEFISTASHEMRTPVASIEGYLGLAMNPATAVIDEKAKSYLQKAHEATQHLGRLFQDLLTVSKAEDARLVPRQQAVDMISFTREVVEGLQQKAKEKGIFVSYAPGDQDTDGNRRITPMYYALVDPDQMREVLSNLLDNAIKYTMQGSVTVDVKGDGDNVTVSVADTGLGIPPEDLPHLFQKFYRVDNSDTRTIGGTGLGLYISRRLTEANNGHIKVTSTFGKGSTFSVQVPRISNERASELLSSSQPGQPSAQPGAEALPAFAQAAQAPVVAPQPATPAAAPVDPNTPPTQQIPPAS